MVIVYEPDQIEIREVWADNLDTEIRNISDIVDDYPYVAMDTEFPGAVFQGVGFNSLTYEVVKTNVNRTKLIQLGLTFTDADGRLPTCGRDKHCLWQFNFREFDKSKDQHVTSSIELLTQHGIDLEKNMKDGVVAVRFGELLISSGVVLNDEVHWITFHGASDFGYLMKILTGKDLPDTRAEFDEKIKAFFPVIYDIKYLLSHTDIPPLGLAKTAQRFELKRVGTSHQAGSDSLLTNRAFLKLRETYFPDQEDLEKHKGVIYGVELSSGLKSKDF